MTDPDWQLASSLYCSTKGGSPGLKAKPTALVRNLIQLTIVSSSARGLGRQGQKRCPAMLLRVGYGRGPGPASPVEASYPRRALQRPHEPDMHLPTLLPDGKPGSREQELERDAPLIRTVAGCGAFCGARSAFSAKSAPSPGCYPNAETRTLRKLPWDCDFKFGAVWDNLKPADF